MTEVHVAIFNLIYAYFTTEIILKQLFTCIIHVNIHANKSLINILFKRNDKNAMVKFHHIFITKAYALINKHKKYVERNTQC